MLTFFSASTRMVNSRRGITECMESALGADTSDCDLVIIHASLGHDFTELIETAGTLAPRAKVLAASCFGVVGKERVSESIKDMTVMGIKG